MRARWRALLTAVCCVGLLSCPVSAQEPDAILLTSDRCAADSFARVTQLVALEVSPRAVVSDSSANIVTTEAQVVCEHEQHALVRVTERSRAAPLQISLALPEPTVAARERSLALAIAELIATGRLETGAQTPKRPSARSTDPTRAHDAAADARWQLWLAPGLTYGARPATLVPALTVGGAYAPGAFALGADLRWEQASPSVSEATVQLVSLSAAVGVAWRLRAGRWQLHLGPALRGGYARLRGTAAAAELEGAAISGTWLGPCVQAALAWQLASHWATVLSVEGGYTVRELRGQDAQGNPLFALAGPWLTLQVGIRWDAGSEHTARASQL